MDFPTRLLFEDKLYLLVATLAALAVAVAVYRRRGTPASRRAIFITIAACGALFMLQALVVTDRERLTALVRGLVRAADQGDIVAISDRIDPSGVTLGHDGGVESTRDNFVAACGVGLQEYQVDEAGASGIQCRLAGDSAEVSFGVRCDLKERHGGSQTTFSQWRIECCRTPDGWKLRRILSARLGVPGFGNAPGIDVLNYLKGLQRQTAGASTP